MDTVDKAMKPKDDEKEDEKVKNNKFELHDSRGKKSWVNMSWATVRVWLEVKSENESLITACVLSFDDLLLLFCWCCAQWLMKITKWIHVISSSSIRFRKLSLKRKLLNWLSWFAVVYVFLLITSQGWFFSWHRLRCFVSMKLYWHKWISNDELLCLWHDNRYPLNVRMHEWVVNLKSISACMCANCSTDIKSRLPYLRHSPFTCQQPTHELWSDWNVFLFAVSVNLCLHTSLAAVFVLDIERYFSSQ